MSQPLLKRGSKGVAVRRLQEALKAAGFSLEIDGDFGARTEAAVRDFQRKKGLDVDGVVGDDTWKALRKFLGEKADERLNAVGGVVDLGHWMQDRGFVVSEHPSFGVVHQVHTTGSLHYVAQALDVNHNFHSADDAREWANETEALKWLYDRVLRAARKHEWPLDEMFFDGFGFRKEAPNVNAPIGGHDTHLHVGFFAKTW